MHHVILSESECFLSGLEIAGLVDITGGHDTAEYRGQVKDGGNPLKLSQLPMSSLSSSSSDMAQL